MARRIQTQREQLALGDVWRERMAMPTGPHPNWQNSDLITRAMNVSMSGNRADTEALANGTATADDIIRLMNGPAGHWWAPTTAWDPNEAESYAYQGYDGTLTPGRYKRDNTIEDEENWYDVPVMLFGKRPLRNDQPWDPESNAYDDFDNYALPEKSAIDLHEVWYQPDFDSDWVRVPATGRSIHTSSISKQAFEHNRIMQAMPKLKDLLPTDNSFLERTEATGINPEYGASSFDTWMNTRPQGPTKWYHVSPAELNEGDHIVPGGGPETTDFYQSAPDNPKNPLPPYDKSNRRDHVWVSPDLESAQNWSRTLNAPNIYEVHPGDSPQAWNFRGNDGYVTPKARVKKRISP